MYDDFLQCNVPAGGMPYDFEHYSLKRHPGAPWVVEKASLGSSKGALGVQKDSWGVPGEPKVVSQGSPECQGGAPGRPWEFQSKVVLGSPGDPLGVQEEFL